MERKAFVGIIAAIAATCIPKFCYIVIKSQSSGCQCGGCVDEARYIIFGRGYCFEHYNGYSFVTLETWVSKDSEGLLSLVNTEVNIYNDNIASHNYTLSAWSCFIILMKSHQSRHLFANARHDNTSANSTLRFYARIFLSYLFNLCFLFYSFVHTRTSLSLILNFISQHPRMKTSYAERDIEKEIVGKILLKGF